MICLSSQSSKNKILIIIFVIYMKYKLQYDVIIYVTYCIGGGHSKAKCIQLYIYLYIKYI